SAGVGDAQPKSPAAPAISADFGETGRQRSASRLQPLPASVSADSDGSRRRSESRTNESGRACHRVAGDGFQGIRVRGRDVRWTAPGGSGGEGSSGGSGGTDPGGSGGESCGGEGSSGEGSGGSGGEGSSGGSGGTDPGGSGGESCGGEGSGGEGSGGSGGEGSSGGSGGTDPGGSGGESEAQRLARRAPEILAQRLTQETQRLTQRGRDSHRESEAQRLTQRLRDSHGDSHRESKTHTGNSETRTERVAVERAPLAAVAPILVAAVAQSELVEEEEGQLQGQQEGQLQLQQEVVEKSSSPSSSRNLPTSGGAYGFPAVAFIFASASPTRAACPKSPSLHTKSPCQQPESPSQQPESPSPQPKSPNPPPKSPCQQPESPSPQPKSPCQRPESPSSQPESSRLRTKSPCQQPGSPKSYLTSTSSPAPPPPPPPPPSPRPPLTRLTPLRAAPAVNPAVSVMPASVPREEEDVLGPHVAVNDAAVRVEVVEGAGHVQSHGQSEHHVVAVPGTTLEQKFPQVADGGR
ncbi:unnamed protein product, partial [Lampetra fluviatilis]